MILKAEILFDVNDETFGSMEPTEILTRKLDNTFKYSFSSRQILVMFIQVTKQIDVVTS